MNLEDLRKIIEDKLIVRGMDEDIALTVADEIVDQYKEIEEEGMEYKEEYD